MNTKPLAFAAVLALPATAPASLWVDFNSTNQEGAAKNQEGYQAYDAAHEQPGTFTTMNYSAFGTTIGVTPSWPNTTDARVQQMIERSATFNNNWDNGAGDLDLVRDWLGIDTRTGNGGNGNWDGAGAGDPTWLDLTFTGIPAGVYNWTSFHHDTEHVHGNFRLQLSLDGGSNFVTVGDLYMSDSTDGGNPNSALDGFPGPQVGPDALSLLSTFSAPVEVPNGATVVARFAPLANTAVHRQLFGINGFRLDVIPEPSTALLGLFGAAGLLLRRRR